MDQKILKEDNSANMGVVVTIAATAISLYVVTVVIGKMSTLSTTLGLTGTSLAGFGNVTDLTFAGLQIAAVGILVIAGVGILSYFGMGFGRK
jgi:hypothetical protein